MNDIDTLTQLEVKTPRSQILLISFSYMGLNTYLQRFVERLNDLNRYLLYFPEENPKHLDQDESIEILDQAKAWNPEWHEVIINAKIDIF
jgi:hypothetical protein